MEDFCPHSRGKGQAVSNKYLSRLVHTRAVQAACSRMSGQVAGDITAAMGHKELGNLQAGMAIVVPDGGGSLQYRWDIGAGTFDENSPPSGFKWWVPDEDDPPPSLSARLSNESPLSVDHKHQGTDGGNGTGKTLTVWDGTQFVIKVAGRLLARIEQRLDGVPGYKGFVAKSIARKVVGRAASTAIATVFSNTLSKDRRKTARRFISTRRWADNKFVGRHCGYAAYYRPRGRIAWPEWLWIERELARQRKRGKGGKSRNKHGGPTPPKTVRPRPTFTEWQAIKKNPVIGTARVMDHRRGKAWVDGFEDFVAEHLDKSPDDIAADIGQEAAKVIKREAVTPFFKWMTKGAQAQRPRTQHQVVNTPTTTF